MGPSERMLIGIDEQPQVVVIRLDGGETFEIAPDAVPDDLPEVGGSISSPLLHILQEAATRKRAARRLFELLDRKLWTVKRLRRKLLDDGLDPDAVDIVLAKAEARGLISDRDYAEAFCRDALRSKQVGRRWLVAKLQDKGVQRQLADDVATEQLPEELERELAELAATKRWQRERGKDRRKSLASVLRFLGSRGFPPGLCHRAARQCEPPDTPPEELV